MATILPFPSIRRFHFVRSQAASMLKRPPDEAEAYLRWTVKRQRETFERKGVDADLIDADISALETAIRVAVWRAERNPNNAA
jgi:hypothetical protein